MFKNYLKAGYACLWVQTHEEDRAIITLSMEAGDNYSKYTWDLGRGLLNHTTEQIKQVSDPRTALKQAETLPEDSVMFMKDFHKFLGMTDVFRTLKNLLPILKSTNRHIVFISPVVQIPVEVQKDIYVMDFALPTTQELTSLAKQIAEDNEYDVQVDEKVIEVARGLTYTEAENVFARSLLTENAYSRRVLEEQKMQIIKQSGLMEIYPPVAESELGGVWGLKRYIMNWKRGFQDPNLPTPQGLILFGPPGSGKSLSVKVISSVLGFPLLRLDFASLKDSHVGGGEAKVIQACSLIEAVAPVVIFMDEIEKAVGGVQSSNRTDGGATSAMFGLFLTWLEESKKIPKYLVGTCNGIEELLAISQGALIRAGRIDDVFFLDLPTDEERKAILDIMNRRYKTEIPSDITSRMINWTGAEIEKFVKASIFEGLDEAFINVKPIYEQNREIIERGRDWARLNARLANGNSDLATTDPKKKASRKIA